NVHRGEEIFQEVFLLVWAKRTLYEFPRPFKPWLYQIAVNRCRQELRLKRLGLVDMPFLDPLDIQAAPTFSPAEVAIQTETASLVQEALLTLPTKQREVVVMRVWGGLSYAQIAQATGRRESSVRSHMHHALTTLRARLEARLR
ncbi:MAG: RNA polymerase sigma factor, partial [Phycisphaeraceae bacterium]|nr:RNA polymerase sigma factor [Phycisphaeraceae bacterium]